LYKHRINLNNAILLLIFVSISASTILWVLQDKTPPPWDPADHISTAYDYYRFIAHLDIKGFYKEFFEEIHYYAPFVHIVTASVFLIFGASKISAIVVNLISLAAILISSQAIYEHIFFNKYKNTAIQSSYISPGVLAGLLATSYHFPAWLLHDAFLDYPLMAIVTVSFALLLKTENFTNRRNSIALGVTLAIGMLTKQTFGFFLMLPLAYSAYRAIVSRESTSILNLFMTSATAIGLASIWYIPHLDDVIGIYRINQEGAVNENEAPVFSFMSNVFYLHALTSAQLQLPFAILFLSGLIYSIIRFRKESIPLYLWVISGIGTFTIIANKDIRYTIPVLPAVAIISVCWLARPDRSNQSNQGAEKSGSTRTHSRNLAIWPRTLLVTVITIWASLSFINAQWPRSGTGYYIDTPNFRWMVFARNYYGFDHAPLSDDWSVPEIVKAVIENSSGQPVLSVTVNLPYLNPSAFTLYSQLMTSERAGPPLIKVDSLVSDNDRDRVKDCQYLLVRTGLQFADWKAPVESYAQEYIRQNPDRFEEIASFPIPLKEAQAVLYRRKAAPTEQSP